jgi:DNA repair photolyase
MELRTVFGTQEWAKYSENCIKGCSHDCKYCYAKANAIRMKRKTMDNWKNEEVNGDKLSKGFRNRDGKIMFPTTHDITPDHLDECIYFLGNILKPGNDVLIVSKPHLECIETMCKQLTNYKSNILFRFTIGSADSAVLRFWEPNAPDFEERLASLIYAYDMGYQTSVSCEPMLEGNIDEHIVKVSPFVTNSIWLGKMNHPGERLAHNGSNDAETLARVRQLMAMY